LLESWIQASFARHTLERGVRALFQRMFAGKRKEISHAHLTTFRAPQFRLRGSTSCTRKLSKRCTRVRRRDANVDVHGPVDAVTEDTTVPEMSPATRPSSYVRGVLGNPPPESARIPCARARITCTEESIGSISSPASTQSFSIICVS